MNERIRLLAEQAGAKFPFGGFVNYDQFDCEKFAELIVKECAEKFAAEPDRPFYGRHVSYHIKKHFGVEE